jgi:hypothetical protein
MPTMTITLRLDISDEEQRALAWNHNDEKPLTRDEIKEWAFSEIRNAIEEIVDGRHGYREAMARKGLRG